MKNLFLNYINRFRGLAIIFVVVSHCIRLCDWQDHIFMEKMILNFFIEGTTLFVFISGYLLEHLKSKFQLIKFYKAKIKNVILPYILISIPAILLYVLKIKTEHEWILTNDFKSSTMLFQVFKFYLTGAHLGPLWYIPMACLLFLISPFLLKIIDTRYKYIALIFFLFISLYYPKPYLNTNAFIAFMHYIFMYFLGMLFSNKKERINRVLAENKSVILLSILCVVFFILMAFKVPYSMFIQKKVLCVLILSVFLMYEEYQGFKFLDNLAKVSFGVYFIHGYIIGAMVIIFKKMNLTLSGAVYFIPISIAVIAISQVLIMLCKKVFKGYSRYIIGS